MTAPPRRRKGGDMARKTALYDRHIALGGKMVEFAGYMLPVQYSGITLEHRAVRQEAGIFDVSHMGEFLFTGEGAEEALNRLLTNDIRGMRDGQARYSLMANERGGAVDDVIVGRERADKFWMVVNAANRDKDAEWVKAHLTGDGVRFRDVSDDVTQVALQGPAAEKILSAVAKKGDIPAKYYTFSPDVSVGGVSAVVARTGYTGEDGFELYVMNAVGERLCDILDDAAKAAGVTLTPCGLGARDTLRLEAGMPLYGHELGEDIPVTETGLGFAIKKDKGEFVGREAIAGHVPEYCRVGARVAGRGIVREQCDIYSGDELVGKSTSGTFSPTLGEGICMLRIRRAFVDRPLEADVRGRRIPLERVELPFYKRPKKA